jgi:hypothetical protein
VIALSIFQPSMSRRTAPMPVHPAIRQSKCASVPPLMLGVLNVLGTTRAVGGTPDWVMPGVASGLGGLAMVCASCLSLCCTPSDGRPTTPKYAAKQFAVASKVAWMALVLLGLSVAGWGLSAAHAHECARFDCTTIAVSAASELPGLCDASACEQYGSRGSGWQRDNDCLAQIGRQ